MIESLPPTRVDLDDSTDGCVCRTGGVTARFAQMRSLEAELEEELLERFAHRLHLAAVSAFAAAPSPRRTPCGRPCFVNAVRSPQPSAGHARPTIDKAVVEKTGLPPDNSSVFRGRERASARERDI